MKQRSLSQLSAVILLLIASMFYVFSAQSAIVQAQEFAYSSGAVSWNPAGTKLAATRKYGFVILDSHLHVTTPVISYNGAVYDIAWSPLGDKIATGDATPTVHIWNAQNGSLDKILHLPNDAGYGGFVAWSPKGQYLLTGVGHNMYVWDISAGTVIATLHTTADVSVGAVAWSPDGSKIAVATADRNGGYMHIWDAASFKELITFDLDSNGVTGTTWLPNSTQVVTPGPEVWDASNGNQVITDVCSAGTATTVTVSPDGKSFATAGIDESSSSICIVGQRDLLLDSFTTSRWGEIAWNPDGKSVVAITNNQLKSWDTKTGQIISAKYTADEDNGSLFGLVEKCTGDPYIDSILEGDIYRKDFRALSNDIKTYQTGLIPDCVKALNAAIASLTSIPTPTKLPPGQPLKIAAACKSDSTAEWQISNSNDFDVRFTWSTEGATASNGKGTIAATYKGTPGTYRVSVPLNTAPTKLNVSSPEESLQDSKPTGTQLCADSR